MNKIIIFIFSVLFCCSIFAEKVSNNLISIQTIEGQKIFQYSDNTNDFWSLIRYFSPQANLGDCSIASISMVLNALHVKPEEKTIYHPYDIFNQQNIFTPQIKKFFSEKQIKYHGLSLNQAALFLQQFPVKIKVFHADRLTYLKFKKILEKTLSSNNNFVIVNYSRSSIGEMGGGHFSPLGAYSKQDDQFLIMDVSSYKYPFVWIDSKTLWNAINTRDIQSNMYRGIVLVSK